VSVDGKGSLKHWQVANTFNNYQSQVIQGLKDSFVPASSVDETALLPIFVTGGSIIALGLILLPPILTPLSV